MSGMEKKRINKKLSKYMRWPLYLSIFLLIMNIIIYMVDRDAGVVASIAVVFYILFALGLFLTRSSSIMSGLVEYASDYSQVQRHLLRELLLPYAIVDTEGFIMWGNDEFSDLLGEKTFGTKNIQSIFPEIRKDLFPLDMMDKTIHIQWNERAYKVVIRKIEIDNFAGKTQDKKIDGKADDCNTLIAVYFKDETELNEAIQELDKRKMLVGLLYIDNYEEALTDVDEVKASLLTALIDRKVTKYMQSMDAIVKKLEKDKYFFLFPTCQQELHQHLRKVDDLQQLALRSCVKIL